MKTLIVIIINILSLSSVMYGQKIDTLNMDSLAIIKRDKKLIEMAKEVVLKHGPGYYREFQAPIIRQQIVSDKTRDLSQKQEKRNKGRLYYTVEYPYDDKIETFTNDYAAKIYFWEDFTIFDILFGHGMGIFDYDKRSKSEKKNLVIPFEKWPPVKAVADTIRDEKGKIIEIRHRVIRQF